MRKLVLLVVLVTLSACSVSYKAGDMHKSINQNLPKKIDLKVADFSVKSLKSLKLDEKEQRIYFAFDCQVETRLGDAACKAFRISAKPALKDGKIIMTDIRADDLNCVIPLTDFANWVKNRFLTEVDVVQLSGIKKAVVKGVYIKGEEIVVKVGIF